MSTNYIQAVPTEHGLTILTDELAATATEYVLIGALELGAASLTEFFRDTISASYYDDEGIMTFVVDLPIDTDFGNYLYQINIVDADDITVLEVETPKVSLAKGIGGQVTIKTTITGQPTDIIFKKNDYVTISELVDVHLPPLEQAIVDVSEAQEAFATKVELDDAISNLIGAAPEALDTLEELAAKLNDGESETSSIVLQLSELSAQIAKMISGVQSVGLALKADQLSTARKINGTAFDGSTDISTANWGTSRTITIGNSAKAVSGAANVSYTLAEIGAAAASHSHSAYARGDTLSPSGTYYQIRGANNSDSYICTPASGLLPNKSGGASTVGTSSWPFSTMYATTFHGALNGNATTCTVNSSASTTYYDILWASGNNHYRASSSKLQVQPSSGNIRTAGHVTFQYTSDINIKRNLKEFDNPLGKVCQLRTGTYEKLQVIEGREADEVGNYPTEYRPESGFIAQDLERVLDNVIYENDDGLKVIRGGGFEIEALLAGAIKQLKREHDEEINQLRQQVQSLMEAQ